MIFVRGEKIERKTRNEPCNRKDGFWFFSLKDR
jgi:hypothetical protein